MTTTATPPIRKANWTELKEPEMIKFDAEGMEVSGYLLDMQLVSVKGKPTREYTIQLDDSGAIATFLGTYSIDKKIIPQWPKARGCRLAIKYLGENTQIKTQGNNMKIFTVLCDFTNRIGGVTEDGLHITDADLPDFLK